MNPVSPLEMFNKYKHYVEGELFLSAEILDDLADTIWINKRRKIVPIVINACQGTCLPTVPNINKLVKLIDNPKPGVRNKILVVCVSLMNHIIISGFKGFPWTSKRREYVSYFFSNHLIPDFSAFNFPLEEYAQKENSFTNLPTSSVEEPRNCKRARIDQETCDQERPRNDPETCDVEETSNVVCLALNTEDSHTKNTSRKRTYRDDVVTEQVIEKKIYERKRYEVNAQMNRERIWHMNPSQFWRDVLKYVQKKNISLEAFIAVCQENSERRYSQNRKQANEINESAIIAQRLVIGTKESKKRLDEAIALEIRCGNWSSLYDVIQRSLKVRGLKNQQLLSSRGVLKKIGKELFSGFLDICDIELTYSGFRADLTKCVKFAVFLSNIKQEHQATSSISLQDICVDIWGDAVEIGNTDIVRLAFRILSRGNPQSAKNVFTFAVFRGHDSRYNLERNIGCKVIGRQNTSWLYEQTKSLHDQGARVTYSGDQPFLLKLFTNTSNDYTSSSMLPLYIDETTDHPTPLTVDSKSKKRLDVKIPLREKIPYESLAYASSVACICPDISHFLVRCCEGDLKKIVDRIMMIENDKVADEKVAQLERNITEREVKKLKFKIEKSTKKKECQEFKFSGRDAILLVADISEFRFCEKQPNSLFHNVFSEKEVLDGCDDEEKFSWVTVLKGLHGKLFNKEVPNNSSRFISLEDALELWRQSLNQISNITRDCSTSMNEAELQKYIFWAETYYQISLALFADKAITPYKLKAALIPQLLEKGFIQTPYNHLTEGLENSNHHSNKNFFARTMRGGGRIWTQNPAIMDMYYSFCIFIKGVIIKSDDPNSIEITKSPLKLIDQFCVVNNITNRKRRTYLEICSNYLPSVLPCGQEVPNCQRLSGLRFLPCGTFPQFGRDKIDSLIKKMGGIILGVDAAKLLIKRHTNTPFCYILVGNKKVLTHATSEELQADQIANSKAPVSTIRDFVGAKWPVLDFKFILESETSTTNLDPEEYTLSPGPYYNRCYVTDIQPLFYFQRNCSEDKSDSNTKSAISLVRHSRALLRAANLESKCNSKDNTMSNVHQILEDDILGFDDQEDEDEGDEFLVEDEDDEFLVEDEQGYLLNEVNL